MKNARIQEKRKRVVFYCLVLSLLITTGFGQVNISDVIQTRFDEYRQHSLQEKIFVHIDKTFFVAGEIMWFKIYNVDGSFNKPLHVSKVAYLEVLDKSNIPVLQAKISLEDGIGNGSLNLPVSLQSGYYMVRAYTNWMKNFSADYFFHQQITIVNSLKISDTVSFRKPTGFDFQFFPEGGNLVSGIKSKGAFRITGEDGKGVECIGAIVNEQNDTILSFKPLKFGIGNFQFTPLQHHSYKAIVKTASGNTYIKQLPVVNDHGYVMSVEDLDEQKIKISVYGKGNEEKSSGTLTLFIHTRQLVRQVTTTTLNNGFVEFIVEKKKLSEGISHFTIFNENQPVCERLYFVRPQESLNIIAKPDKQQYGTRKKVTVQIVSVDQDGKPQLANMSMAVYRLDSLQENSASDILSYLLLTSDLKGNVEAPGYYFSNGGPDVNEALDNIMVTHGWRRFIWEEIIQNKKRFYAHLPEYRGHLITGRVLHTATSTPAGGILGYLSVPGTRLQLFGGASNADGQILFVTKDIFGHNEIIVQTNFQQEGLYHIEINNPFSDKYISTLLPGLRLSESLKSSVLKNSIGMQVQNSFSGNKLKQFLLPAIDTSQFYGQPDRKYLLDDYVRFTTMEEVLKEYIPEIVVRRQSAKFHLYIYNETDKTVTNDPLILLDGVPIFDIDRFMGIDPLKLKELEVITNTYLFGPFQAGGIASFSSYAGDMGGFGPDTGSLVLDYEGLQLQREFYSPVYETEKQMTSRIPDFRSLLLWSPDINVDINGKKEISFYTSDQPGKYMIVIHGLTADGKAGTQITDFEVRAN